MTNQQARKSGQVRKQARSTTWSYVIELGIVPRQRCASCGFKQWVGRRNSRPARSAPPVSSLKRFVASHGAAATRRRRKRGQH